MRKSVWIGVAATVVTVLACTGNSAAQKGNVETSAADTESVRCIRPTSVFEMPDFSLEEYRELQEEAYKAEADSIPECAVYDILYNEGCSWYCGGWVDTLTATSHHRPEGRYTYEAFHAHDFDHESVWATEGKGIGESLTLHFDAKCPRVTDFGILNGHVKNAKAWDANSRVKRLLMYYNERPYCVLELEDSRSLQWFEVDTLGYGPNAKDSQPWTLKFEIQEVYPGSKYDDVVIADFILNGIDVH